MTFHTLNSRSQPFTRLDSNPAYRNLPVNQNSNSNSPNLNSNNPDHRRLIGSPNYHRNSIGSLTSLAPHYNPNNTDYTDSPPPYSQISKPLPYSLYPDLILTEIFEALFHFPDSHPFLID